MTMGCRPRGCDYCAQTASESGTSLERIPLSRHLNGDPLEAEICGHCLREIIEYAAARYAPMD